MLQVNSLELKTPKVIRFHGTVIKIVLNTVCTDVSTVGGTVVAVADFKSQTCKRTHDIEVISKIY